MSDDNVQNEAVRKVVNALRKVIDPDVNINIVDMGFIYRVDVIDDNTVEIDYTLTTMGCPLADVIEQDILNTIKKELGVEAKLKLVWEPTWRLEFMSVDARIELGYPI